jgi:hypothetical protein
MEVDAVFATLGCISDALDNRSGRAKRREGAGRGLVVPLRAPALQSAIEHRHR